MKILIFSAFDGLSYTGETAMRYETIANEFLNNGHEVTFLASSFSHLQKKTRVACNTPPGFQLVLLPTPPYKKNKSIDRVRSHYSLAVALGLWLEKLDQSAFPDIVICATPPVLANYIIARFCQKNNIHFVIDIQDLWPEEFTRFFPLKKIVRFVLRPYYIWAKKTMSMASGITAVSQDYLDYYKTEAGSKPQQVFYLGTDVKQFAQVGSIEKAGESIKIIMLGHSQAGDYIMMAARSVQKIQGAMLTIAGLKEKSAMYAQMIEKENLKGIEIIPWLGADDINKGLPGYDVALILINPQSKSAFPNRAFTYIAAGLPVVNNIRNGELEKCIFENKLGITVVAGEEQIKKGIEYCLELFPASEHQKIQAFGKSNFDRELIYKEYYNWVVELLEGNNAQQKNKING